MGTGKLFGEMLVVENSLELVGWFGLSVAHTDVLARHCSIDRQLLRVGIDGCRYLTDRWLRKLTLKFPGQRHMPWSDDELKLSVASFVFPTNHGLNPLIRGGDIHLGFLVHSFP